jgi:hypothetical protein
VRVRRGYIVRMAAIVALLMALAFGAIGCKAQPAQWSELGSGGERQQQAQRQPERRQGAIRIEAQTNREVADLSPDDVVQIMRRIGFTDAQILDMGTDLHETLFLSGGARVVDGEDTEALLRVSGMQVYIRSRSRGSFVYDLEHGQFVMPGSSR